MANWLDRYMVVPYRDKGRSFQGADCAGHYALIVLHECGVDFGIPTVDPNNERASVDAITAQIRAGRWRQIDGETKAVARRFDAILMTSILTIDDVPQRVPIHIGCATGDGFVVHTEQGRGVRHMALDDSEIKRRIVGVYRPSFLDVEKAA